MFACSTSRDEALSCPEPYYNPRHGVLDLGYRDLRRFHPESYLGEMVEDEEGTTVQLTSRVTTLTGARVGRVLTRLLISHNSLTAMPLPEELPYLRYLDVSHNQLTVIPVYRRLSELVAHHNRITSLVGYQTLQTLDLSHNPLRALDQVKVVHLYLEGCQLREIPLPPERGCSHGPEVQTLPEGVQTLGLGDNQLSSLRVPETVVDLDLADNPLTLLQGGHGLRHLDITRTLISDLPPLQELVGLRADGCPIEHLSLPAVRRVWMDLPVTVDCPELRDLSLRPSPDPRRRLLSCQTPQLQHLHAPGCPLISLPDSPALRTAHLRGSQVRRAIIPPRLESLDIRQTPLETVVPDPRRQRSRLTLTCDWSSYLNLWKTLRPRNLQLHLDGDLLLRSAEGRLSQSEHTEFVRQMDGLRPDQLTEATRRLALYLFRHRRRLSSYRSLTEICQSRHYREYVAEIHRLYMGCVWVELTLQL